MFLFVYLLARMTGEREGKVLGRLAAFSCAPLPIPWFLMFSLSHNFFFQVKIYICGYLCVYVFCILAHDKEGERG